MSWQANGWTASLLDPKKPDPRAAQLRPAHVLVLTMLSIHHDHHQGFAYAQLKRLAAETRLSLREVVNVMNDLEAWDILVIGYGELPKGKRGNLYYLVGLDDTSEAGPRRRLGGRPRADAGIATDQDACSASAEEAASFPSVAPGATFQLHESNSRLIEPAPEQATTRSVVEPVKEPAHARAPEAPPRRAAEEREPAAAPPPKWEEIWPGQYLGRPGGEGEVHLLKARCALCERNFPIDEIEGHDCDPVQRELVHAKAGPGNLGGLFGRRHRPREPIPEEARAELAAMAVAPRPQDIPLDIRAEHERRLEAARQGGSA